MASDDKRIRRGILLAVTGVTVALLLAIGFAGGSDDDPGSDGTGSRSAAAVEPVALPQAESSPQQEVPSALSDRDNSAFPEPLLDPDLVLSGGPPPDGIPAIDQPTFLRTSDVDWLADSEAVLALTIGDDTRAYPVQVMTWHEIVNDTVGGVPVLVTYCPLCNSGVAFDRQVDGMVLDFGTSGLLYASNLVMYDRQTESLWLQVTGRAAFGALTGTTLEVLPLSPVGWADFRAAHPDAWVLSRDTGHARDYGVNPYAGLDNDPDRPPLFGAPSQDDRLPQMERVVGVGSGSTSVTFVRSAVTQAGVLTDHVGDEPIVVLHAVGQASALDDGLVAGGREIGTVAVFDPVVGGQELTFVKAGDAFADEQTGSTWTILGHATDGPLAGEQLDAVPFLDTFWASWVSFAQDTRVVGG